MSYDEYEDEFFEETDYEKQYLDKLDELSKSIDDEDERYEVLGTVMKDFNVKHSEDGSVDAELNWLKARNTHKQRERRTFDKASEDLLRYISRKQNKPERDVRKWAKKILKENPPSYLGRF